MRKDQERLQKLQDLRNHLKRNQKRDEKMWRNAEIIPHDSWELQGDNWYSDISDRLHTMCSGNEEVFDIFESVGLFCRHLYRAETKMDYIISLLTLMKMTTHNRCIITSITGVLNDIIETIFDSSDFELQSMSTEQNVFDRLRKILTYSISCMSEHEGIRRICDIASIFLTGITYNFRDNFFGHHLFKVFKDRKISLKMSESGYFIYIVDSILYLCSSIKKCFDSKSLEPLIGLHTTYSEWYEECSFLISESRRQVDPLMATIDRSLFETRLRKNIEQAKILYKSQPRDSFQKSVMYGLMKDLENIQFTLCCEEVVMSERKAPFCTLIYGSSGICKTQLMDLMYVQYAHTFNKPIGSHYKYNVNVRQKHFDGFNSSAWCTIIDDVSNEKSSKVTEMPKSLDMIFRLCNNLPVVTEQAEASKKGKIAFRSECIIISTNVKHLDVAYYFNNQAAALRRVPYVVTVTPKPELTKDGMLDRSKLNTEFVEGERPDYWTFKVEKVIAGQMDLSTNYQSYSYQTIGEFNNIYDYLAWYSKAAISHVSEQNAVQNIQKGLYESDDMCKTCYYAKSRCNCKLELQNATVDYWWDCLKDYYLTVRCFFIMQIFCFMFRFFPRTEQWLRFCFSSNKDKMYFMKMLFQHLDKDVQSLLRISSSNYRRLKDTIKVVSLISSGFALYHFMYKSTPDSSKSIPKKDSIFGDQGGEVSKPVPLPREKPRNDAFYYNNTVQLQPMFDISAATACARPEFEPMIIKMFEKSSIMTEFYDNLGRTYRVNWICLKSHIYVTNNHSIKSDLDGRFFNLYQTKGISGVSNNVKNCTFYINGLIRDEENDLCYYRFHQIPPKADITKYLPILDLKINLFVNMIVDNKLEDKRIITGRYTLNSLPVPQIGIDNLIVYSGPVSEKTSTGDCGSLVYAKTAQGIVFLGIHSLGSIREDSNLACCTALNITRVNEKIAAWGEFSVESGLPNLVNPKVDVLPLSDKSHIRYVEDGHCNVYGSLRRLGKARPSRACKSYMYEAAIKYGFKDIGAKPCMTSWEPWNLSLKSMVKTNTSIDESILAKCKESYIQDILDNVPMEDIKMMVHPFDWESTINGLPGITYVDGIKRNSSAGFPWCKSKRAFLEENVSELYPEGVKFSDNIMHRIEECEEKLKKGIRVHPIFQGNLKDEVVTQEKADLKKTRVFFGGPMDFIMCQRKYTLGFMRLLKNHKFKFGCAIGINAMSKEWECIVNILKTKSKGLKHLFAGDYSKYDKTMIAILILEAYDIIARICKIADWDAESIQVIKTLAEDTAYSWCNFDGTLIEFFGTNPSGHALTVEINSIVGDLLLRYVYYCSNPKHECTSYSKNVARVIYGDDNLVAVAPAARSFFNHTVMESELKKIGIVYTMADKSSKSKPFSTIDEVTFLKRSFTYNPDLKSYVGLLDENSIHKSITHWIPSKVATPEEQCLSTLSSAAREYFLHGREVYQDKKYKLGQIIHDMHLDHLVEDWVLPDYEDLKMQFDEFEIL